MDDRPRPAYAGGRNREEDDARIPSRVDRIPLALAAAVTTAVAANVTAAGMERAAARTATVEERSAADLAKAGADPAALRGLADGYQRSADELDAIAKRLELDGSKALAFTILSSRVRQDIRLGRPELRAKRCNCGLARGVPAPALRQ